MFAICAPFVDTYRIYCGYDILIMLPLPIPVGKGVRVVHIFLSFLLSVTASVVAYYICKWLDGKR